MSDTSDFDWVSARAECSLVGIFEKLKAQLKKDVVIRQSLENQSQYQFVFTNSGASASVAVSKGHVYDSVSFRLDEGRIIVEDGEGKEKFSAYPTLSDDRQCRLSVKGKERELWQVRKMALESFLFRS